MGFAGEGNKRTLFDALAKTASAVVLLLNATEYRYLSLTGM